MKARWSTSSLLPCNRLHSHRQGTHETFVVLWWTKMELTEYLTAKVIQRSECMGKNVIVAWGCYCQGTHFDVMHLRSSQEEVDTRIILHAVDAASRGATEITIHSPVPLKGKLPPLVSFLARRVSFLSRHFSFLSRRFLSLLRLTEAFSMAYNYYA